jgi:hypothetical protein
MAKITMANPVFGSHPDFKTNAAGTASAVLLDPAAYVTLLVRGNITEPSVWPPGMQQGAAALARVRAIERRCIARHGSFDWEKLSPRLQDEYDSLCALLDQLQDAGERVSLKSYKARRAENGR